MPTSYGRGGGVGRGLGVGIGLGVNVGVGVAEGDAVGVAVAVGVGLAPPTKLNFPIRVCPVPLSAYWLICQKASPSDGSISVLVYSTHPRPWWNRTPANL